MCVLSCPCLYFSLFFLSLCVSLRAAAVVLRTMDGREMMIESVVMVVMIMVMVTMMMMMMMVMIDDGD